VTAYRLTPVGPEGPERHRAQRVEVRSYTDVVAELERVERLWREEVDHRIGVQARLNRSMRVLASLARLSPRMAGVVAAAGREIWQLDREDRRRQSKATRKARVEVYGRLPFIRRYCDHCSVTWECGAYGGTRHGVYGGALRKARGGPDEEPEDEPGCGTPRGYRLHRENGEEPCAACLRAWTEYCQERKRIRLGRTA
jgi:hypothetical protein